MFSVKTVNWIYPQLCEKTLLFIFIKCFHTSICSSYADPLSLILMHHQQERR